MEENEESEEDNFRENIKEDSDSSEEFEPRKRFPVDFDISTDETPSKEFPVSGDADNETENTDGGLGEEGGFESSDFVPSSRFNSRISNPFLEQESVQPIEDLETDLRDVRTNAQINQPEIQNAPQYSSSTGSYSGRGYYEEAEDGTYPRTFSTTMNTQPNFITSRNQPTGFSDDFSPGRMLNPRDISAWRDDNKIQSWDRDEDKKYSTGLETKKRKNDL